jgi:acyl-CoA thioester hydrolase
VTELRPFRAALEPGWIDYNGHLRDAYYVVALSLAIDEAMEELGLDTAYRESTHCTLYTLELHIHYLHEIKAADELSVVTRILDCDIKRIHAACDFICPRLESPAASAEVMLLHVHQGEKPASAPFPPQIAALLERLKVPAAETAARRFSSRKIEITRR